MTIVEVGGTVGDIESQPFLEAIRQVSALEVGRDNCLFMHVTLVPFIWQLPVSTRQNQRSIPCKRAAVLWAFNPDIIVLPAEMSPVSGMNHKQKIAIVLQCTTENCVIQNLDCTFTCIPFRLALEEEPFG